jgi:hypothetical protein
MQRGYNPHPRSTPAARACDIAEAIVLVMIEKGLVDPDTIKVVLEDVLEENRELSASPFLRTREQRLHADICTAVEKMLRGTNFYAAPRRRASVNS